jgi:hypothetical protein
MKLRVRFDLQLWNAAAMVLFILLAAIAYWLVDSFGKFEPLGFLDIVLLSLATFRLSHLFANDKIFDFIRVLAFDARAKTNKY